MTCEELRNKVKMFNEDKENWYRKQTGYSKMKKDELIALCDKCDKTKEIKRRTQYISYQDFFEYILDEDKKVFKRWGDADNIDEEDFIEIEYEWNNFADCRPCESAITIIIPYGENDEKKCCLKKVYNTSSYFALWMCNWDDNESDEEDEEDEADEADGMIYTKDDMWV
jgi:hypothetical protein